jgi:hypothetical protein
MIGALFLRPIPHPKRREGSLGCPEINAIMLDGLDYNAITVGVK